MAEDWGEFVRSAKAQDWIRQRIIATQPVDMMIVLVVAATASATSTRMTRGHHSMTTQRSNAALQQTRPITFWMQSTRHVGRVVELGALCVLMNRKKFIAIASLLLIAAIWFGAVDWSWFVYECPDCGYVKDVTQYRVFEIPVHETVYKYPTVTQRVGIDLGVSCQHVRIDSWHKHRHWGLCVCADPCINGMYLLTSDDSWYTDDVSSKIVALSQNDPLVKAEYSKRVLREHQYQFVKTVLEKAGVN